MVPKIEICKKTISFFGLRFKPTKRQLSLQETKILVEKRALKFLETHHFLNKFELMEKLDIREHIQQKFRSISYLLARIPSLHESKVQRNGVTVLTVSNSFFAFHSSSFFYFRTDGPHLLTGCKTTFSIQR